MIKFTYNSKIELQVFREFSQKRENSEAVSLIEKELAIEIKESEQVVAKYIKLARGVWQESADKFLTALGDFYEQKLSEPDIYCYLIRLNIFPYNFKQGADSWFAAPLFNSPVERNRVIMHELCHFFQPTSLPRPIKEAIPVILNDHERFGMYSFDRGHSDPEEQKWRKIIWEIYNRGEKFSEILRNIN